MYKNLRKKKVWTCLEVGKLLDEDKLDGSLRNWKVGGGGKSITLHLAIFSARFVWLLFFG